MKIKSILFTLSSLLALSADAADIVFDPTNFAKNTLTATESIKQTAIQAQQLAQQAQDLALQTRNLRQIDSGFITNAIARGILPAEAAGAATGAEVAAAAAGVYTSYSKTVDEMKSLYSTYDQMNKVFMDLQRLENATGRPLTKLLEADAKAAAAGRSTASSELTRLQQSLGQLQFHQRRADALVQALPAAGGTVELLQIVGAQNHLMSDQMSQLIQTSVSSAQAAQEAAWQRNGDRERTDTIERSARVHNKKTWGYTE
jgi:P-type conjugative transfer protein TrbJ